MVRGPERPGAGSFVLISVENEAGYTFSLGSGAIWNTSEPETKMGAQLGMFIFCCSSRHSPKAASTITSIPQTFTSSYIQHYLVTICLFVCFTFCSEHPASPSFMFCMCGLVWLFHAKVPLLPVLWVDHCALRAWPLGGAQYIPVKGASEGIPLKPIYKFDEIPIKIPWELDQMIQNS